MTLSADTVFRLQIALVSPSAAADLASNINTPSPGATSITSALATAFTVASTGTNYGFQVDESTASAITGLKLKANASGSGVALTALGGTNELITIDAKGSGTIGLATVQGTGLVQIGQAGISGNGTGITITPASAGSGIAIAAISTGGAEKITIDAKGSGILNLQSVATGAVVFGQGEGATPAVQTIRAPLAAGTDVAGANLTVAGSASTGAGLGGSLIFQVTNKAGTGTTVNTQGSVLTLAPPNTGTTAVVDGVTITGAITTGIVKLAATGSDAQVPLQIDAKGSTSQVILGRANLNTTILSSTKASVGSGNQSATAAQLLNGYITGAQNGNTVTLDTGANLDAAIPGVANGDAFFCAYLNTGAGNGTITGASGTNVKGTTAVVPTNGVGLMFFLRTAGAWDVLVVGKN